MRTKTFSLLVFVVFANILCGQKYNFVNWTVEDGLIQSQASFICQDNYRQLWVGTQGGISKFDGKKFTGYSVQEGLTSNHVNQIFCDNTGRLWIGTNNGMSVFNGKAFTTIRLNPKGANNVRSICQDGQQRLYALNNLRAYEIENLKSRKIYFSGDTLERVTYLCCGPSGHLLAWVFNKGLYQYVDNNTVKKLSGCGNFQNAFVTGMLITSSYDTLLNLNARLSEVKYRQARPYSQLKENNPQINILSMCQDNKGRLWLGCDAGVYRLENGLLQHFDGNSGLTDNSVNHILLDKENNLWFATDADGIFRFRDNTFRCFDRSSGFANPIVMGVAQTRDGSIYAGGYGGGLYSLPIGSVLQPVLFRNKHVLADAKIYALHADNEDNVWIGTINRGIWKYNKKNGAEQLKAAAAADNSFLSSANVLFRDAQNNLLVGNNFGLIVFGSDKKTTQVKFNENVTVTAIKAFGADCVMVGTSKGLYFVNKLYEARQVNNSLFSGAFVLCLNKQDDNVWMGTTDSGIFNWNIKTGKVINYTTTNGLPSNFIYSMHLNGRRVWIGTGYGISRLDYTPQQQVGAVKNYGRADGLLGMECSHNCLLYARDSSLWFGTTKGLFQFSPHMAMPETGTPLIHLKSVKLFSSDISDSTLFSGHETWFNVPNGLKLRPRQNHITFELGAIYFTNPEDVLYNYQLVGIDKDSATTANPVIIYPALPPGKYTLKVRGITKNGLPSSNQLSYTFEIEQAFYQTGLFQLVVVMSLLATGGLIAYLATRSRQRRRQKAKELLEKIREEEFMKLRQRTAEDFHDEMGNNLTRISILTDVLKSKLDNNSSTEVNKLVEQIKENTVLLYNGSRDIIWSLNSNNDGLYEVTEHLRDIGLELFGETSVEFNFRFNIAKNNSLKLKLDYSRNLTMIFKEAYSNILKHAKASHVNVSIELVQQNALHIQIKDNGQGFNTEVLNSGNGLKNIENRVKRMEGQLKLNSRQGKGTEINIYLNTIFA